MSRIDYLLNSYDYFRQINNADFSGQILDYGSNYGRFLESSSGKIRQENYTGIDVDLEALQSGQTLFPRAQFVHYNRYNSMYNPAGHTDCWPVLGRQFDYVVSYSVVTHTSQEDLVEAIGWLYDQLHSGGRMLVSWLDIENSWARKFFYKKRILTFGHCDRIQTQDYVYLIDNRISKTVAPGMLVSFYTRQYLQDLLRSYNPVLVASPVPHTGTWQDCMIIDKA